MDRDTPIDPAGIGAVVAHQIVRRRILRGEDALTERRAHPAFAQIGEGVNRFQKVLRPLRVVILRFGHPGQPESIGVVPVGVGDPVIFPLDCVGVAGRVSLRSPGAEKCKREGGYECPAPH